MNSSGVCLQRQNTCNKAPKTRNQRQCQSQGPSHLTKERALVTDNLRYPIKWFCHICPREKIFFKHESQDRFCELENLTGNIYLNWTENVVNGCSLCLKLGESPHSNEWSFFTQKTYYLTWFVKETDVKCQNWWPKQWDQRLDYFFNAHSFVTYVVL